MEGLPRTPVILRLRRIEPDPRPVLPSGGPLSDERDLNRQNSPKTDFSDSPRRRVFSEVRGADGSRSPRSRLDRNWRISRRIARVMNPSHMGWKILTVLLLAFAAGGGESVRRMIATSSTEMQNGGKDFLNLPDLPQRQLPREEKGDSDGGDRTIVRIRDVKVRDVTPQQLSELPVMQENIEDSGPILKLSLESRPSRYRRSVRHANHLDIRNLSGEETVFPGSDPGDFERLSSPTINSTVNSTVDPTGGIEIIPLNHRDPAIDVNP